MKVKIDDEVWCELVVADCVCNYKFMLLNIPCMIGGHKQTGEDSAVYGDSNCREALPQVIEGIVLCDSNEDAKQCARAIQALIENGYGEQPCGIIGMDMADVFEHFNGEPMKYLHKILASTDDIESLRAIQEKVRNSHFVTYAFSLSKDCVNQTERGLASMFESILSDVDADTLWQVSLTNGEERTLDVWYR